MKRACFVFVAILALAASAEAALAADRLPDLGMARIDDIRIDRTADGRRLLRYSTTIVNVGAGPFEVRGERTAATDPGMTTVQRVYDDAGGFRYVPSAATLVLGGDGHNHWHVRDLETSELTRLDNGVKVGTGAKRGFCFWDNVAYRLTLAGAPPSPAYSSTGCGNAASLEVVMGLSVGWGDEYPAVLPDQYVNITGLIAGRYRLYVTADAADWFLEAGDASNTTWVDLQIKGHGAPRILGYGPSA
jgi:hypothetical protein